MAATFHVKKSCLLKSVSCPEKEHSSGFDTDIENETSVAQFSTESTETETLADQFLTESTEFAT